MGFLIPTGGAMERTLEVFIAVGGLVLCSQVGMPWVSRFSPANATEPKTKVVLEAGHEVRNGKVYVTAKTNLPEGTSIMVTLRGPGGEGDRAQSKGKVVSGSFTTEGFTDHGERLNGDYEADIYTMLNKYWHSNEILEKLKHYEGYNIEQGEMKVTYKFTTGDTSLEALKKSNLSSLASQISTGMSRTQVIRLLGRPAWASISGDQGEYAVPGSGIALYLYWDKPGCPVAVDFDRGMNVIGVDEGRYCFGSSKPPNTMSCKKPDRAKFCK